MNQRRQQPKRQDNNQGQGQMTDQDADRMIAVRVREIIGGIEQMRGSIEAMLPRAVAFDKFRSIVMGAIRHNPDIINCHGGSIVTACMKAAYDGLMLDGREAALVPSSNKYKHPITGKETWRKEARYSSMVAGLRKQVIAGGKVRDLKTTLVYANEKFEVVGGLRPDIIHKVIVDSEQRGEPVAAYSVAWFHDGGEPSFEVMNKREIDDVRESSQSGPVWKGKFALEMWRKTVLRRHRKALPGGNDVIDMEARELFPQFVQGPLEHALDAALPATTQKPDAPRRADFAQLEQHANGVEMDFGSSGEMSEEEALRTSREDDGEQDRPIEQKRAAAAVEPEREQQEKETAKAREIRERPDGFDTWEDWQADVASKMKLAATLPRLDQVVLDAQPMFDVAPEEQRDQLGELYELKATDHREAMK